MQIRSEVTKLSKESYLFLNWRYRVSASYISFSNTSFSVIEIEKLPTLNTVKPSNLKQISLKYLINEISKISV